MGFNFQAGHPHAIFDPEEGAPYAALLRKRFGGDVPLGDPSEPGFLLRGEIAWPCWQELQSLARERLGDERSRHVCAVDAWHAVYVDAEIEHEVLRFLDREPTRTPDGPFTRRTVFVLGSRRSIIDRFLCLIGIRPERPSSETDRVIDAMVGRLGARKGERDGLQVSGLRGLVNELNALLAQLGVEVNEHAVEALYECHAENDDRIGSAIQGLCHAWLTAEHALAHGTPMWLIK